MKRLIWFICLLAVLLLATTVSGSTQEVLSNYTTSMVADINPGSGHGLSWPMAVFQNKLYTQADDGVHGRELWVYDGKNPPSMVADINPGAGSGWPFPMIVFNNKLHFGANDGTNGVELWEYDGTNPPSMVANINSSTSSSPDNFQIYNGKLYFAADNGTNGRELWIYDGVNPPYLVADICSGACGGLPIDAELKLTVFNGKLYFNANDGTNGYELWSYDGSNPPSMVADIHSGAASSYPTELTEYYSQVYFTADDGANGIELWSYDGTNPPSMVWDINPGASSSNPQTFGIYKGQLFFRADDGTHGTELWVKQPTLTPSMLADINPGSASSYNQFFAPDNQFANYNDKFFFLADDGVHGQELWFYDNSNPPGMAADINTGSGDSEPRRLQPFSDKLYFSGNDGTHGYELWVFEPVIVKDMFYSQGTFDGWVRETGENTNKGGLINTTNLTCYVGDDGLNRQFRTILHFNTSRLPDDAVITKSSLQIKEHSWVGDPPYLTLGNLWADIRQGWFSDNPGLVKSDFAAAPSMGFAGWLKVATTPLPYTVFRASIKSSAFQYINLAGSTQFRVRYAIDDDNDNDADYIKIFCGDMPVPFNRPVLRVWYYIP
jgi:ELWxxDGT repeat protein